MEDLTHERDLAHFNQLSNKNYELIYNGLWFSPLMDAIQAFLAETQKVVNGVVRVKLFKGNVICEGRKSLTLYILEELATYTSADQFDQEAAAGFIKLWDYQHKFIFMLKLCNK